MPREFEDIKDGTMLEPFHLNMIYRELRRWRKAKAVVLMVLDSAASADSPPVWRMEIDSPSIARAVVTTAIPTGTIGTPSDTGEVTLYNWDGTTSDAGDTAVSVLNDMTIAASVPIGTVVKIAMIDGDYWLIASECY